MSRLTERSADQAPERIADYHTEITRLLNAMAYDENQLALSNLTDALVYGLATISGLFSSREQSERFIERCADVLKTDAAEQYDEMAEARDKIGAAHFMAIKPH